ncbi:AMP-binding protein [Anaeromyxobacter paludicola]|uniref:AMP-binding protein n=1 Tax=Anaeromyxobacter paludicola TaxID=2918171 RepID=A0ABN6NAG2_9BACT|nr:AMP-binding protein [Anaeromyxobacter paludicola]BDG10026.1 AMP-binding protein [Anaeromyxobacter paludicola]
MNHPTDAFRAARDFLVEHRLDYDRAYRDFRWPALDAFNYATDWFDAVARGNRRLAIHLVGDDGRSVALTYEELSERSTRVAAFLRRHGCGQGDRILMMLPNCAAIWELMLGAMKLGAAVIPASTLLTPDDLRDRLSRGGVRHVVTHAAGTAKLHGLAEGVTRIAVGAPVPGWVRYEDAYDERADLGRPVVTRGSDPVLIYFTSGTTARPKLVAHTQQSYAAGHLSTLYWIGSREGDVHMNVSSPGWGKHAWSSFFVPFTAGATAFVHDYTRFSAAATLEVLARHEVTTLCAPPTVWRLLILEDLARHPVRLREALSAGEPLNPEVIERVRQAWGLTIRDGYGQTETTALVGNSPGQPIVPGSMGRPLPGFRVALLDGAGAEAEEGEIAVALSPRPAGVMAGYLDDPELTANATRGGFYRTGDVARRDANGYVTYVGRADDLFKSSDYRISPFELESALVEHAAVAEAAVVPSPDPVRGTVPKAFLVLRPGAEPTRALALDVFRFVRERLAPYKRVRRIEFGDLPKTISGKIRRIALRGVESARRAEGGRVEGEYWQEDFPELG